MTIKQKFQERIDRIKNYNLQVRVCRNTVKELGSKRYDITAIVNSDKVDETCACIKAYHTTAPATDMSQVGENVYFHVQNCHQFDNNVCPVFNCPYNAKHRAYKTQERLLQLARKNKKLAFERIFEHIK